MLLRRGAVRQSYIRASTFSVYLDHLPVTVKPDRTPLVGQQIHVCRLDVPCRSFNRADITAGAPGCDSLLHVCC